MVDLTMNYNTGTLRSNAPKEDRTNDQVMGQAIHKSPTARNVYGDEEFVVKLQPPISLGFPNTPWMCYDGPVRSFQSDIDPNTSGLSEVYRLLQRDGIAKVNPMFGLPGYKGYFMARWEGSHIRVFYDRLVSPQAW
jgi:hypothetical protein